MYTLLIIIIICWTLGPFIKKKIMNIPSNNDSENINAMDFLLISNIIALFVILVFYFINSKDKYTVMGTFKKLSLKHWMYFCLNALVTLTSTFLFVFVLKKGSISKIFPTVQATVIIASFFLASYLLKEQINVLQMTAIGFISTGILLLHI